MTISDEMVERHARAMCERIVLINLNMDNREATDEMVKRYVDARFNGYMEQSREYLTAALQGSVVVPAELTADNGAKTALMGEFYEEFEYVTEDGEDDCVKIWISWTNLKAIHRKMVAHFASAVPRHELCAPTSGGAKE